MYNDITRGYNLAGKILTLHVNKSSSILDDSINILYYILYNISNIKNTRDYKIN